MSIRAPTAARVSSATLVSMAGGTYAGQSALAIGVSQLSDTGKWVYKMQGTTDSRGQFGASIGAGMHW